MDRNPRSFYIEAVDITANVDADATEDSVTIEFAGRITPTVKDRLYKAIFSGNCTITEKRLT
jgi:hypothetical protein